MTPTTACGALLEAPSTHETRAVRLASTLLDLPVHSATLEGLRDSLSTYAPRLASGQLLPVGSVEFVREAMRQGGLKEPEPIGFPAHLQPWYRRTIGLSAAGSVAGRWFVKPVRTKQFNGFVFDSTDRRDELSDHDREQHAAFAVLAPEEPVWVSEPVRFLSEWRFYVHGGRIVGSARYDPDGADDAPEPDLDCVHSMIAALGARAPCGLDVGVLHTGETALVEINDAWALGLYGQALDAKAYYWLLRDYWSSAVARVRD